MYSLPKHYQQYYDSHINCTTWNDRVSLAKICTHIKIEKVYSPLTTRVSFSSDGHWFSSCWTIEWAFRLAPIILHGKILAFQKLYL